MSQYPQQPPQPWQQGTVQYGYQQPRHPLSGLATAVKILLGVMAAVAAWNAYVLFDRAGIIQGFVDGDRRPSELFDADDRVVAAIGVFGLGLLATGIVFIIWHFRYATNARALGANQGLGPGWAIGGWFIPCANYVLPAVQLFQSSKGSNPQRRGAGIITAWGIVFGASIALFPLAYFGLESDSEGNLIVDSTEDVDALINADRLAGLALVMLIVAAIIAIVMVGRLTDDQATAQPSQVQPGAYPPPSFGVPPASPSSYPAPPPAPPAPGVAPQAPPTAPPTPPGDPQQWTPPGESTPPPF